MRLERAQPLPELHGDALIRALLAEIEEDDVLGRSIGVDLTPAGPAPGHAPLVYGPLDVWLQRSEEIHRFLEETWRAERHAGEG
jgi:hypothetical protein